jgi:serine/threonine-protein kinase RIO1
MKNFIDALLSNNLIEAKRILDERLDELADDALTDVKEDMALEMFDVDLDELEEGNIMKMGRTKMIRVRIRGGKIQRRKRLSAVKGYTTRGGKLVRMSPVERRNRKMASRRSKFKRRAKLRQALRKRKMSLRRRSAMGL